MLPGTECIHVFCKSLIVGWQVLDSSTKRVATPLRHSREGGDALTLALSRGERDLLDTIRESLIGVRDLVAAQAPAERGKTKSTLK